jgi:hypothetical protein
MHFPRKWEKKKTQNLYTGPLTTDKWGRAINQSAPDWFATFAAGLPDGFLGVRNKGNK